MGRYAATIFLSAFLLFQVQPIVAKLILPWFGGSPAVWTTCMLFFQLLLLAGYSYAHLAADQLSPRVARVVHLALLAASLWFLPIAHDAVVWKPSGQESPVGAILLLLTATIGLPYFVLSSTGPLLQEGFRRETGRAPYRLYALSNVGSLLALLTYPFVFEPQLSLHTQIVAWSWSYGVFVAACGWCVWRFTAVQPAVAAKVSPTAKKAKRPGGLAILLWMALAACGSVMLLATTNQMSQEIPAVPFLWVVPLALYLVSFIICFDRERWYHRNLFLGLLAVAVVLAALTIYGKDAMGISDQLAAYSATLFICCMVCHGELARAKPAAEYATLFYLVVSAGGALGGILVAVVAPLVLPDFYEYQIGLVVTIVLAFVATFSPAEARKILSPRHWAIGGALTAAAGVAIILIIRQVAAEEPDEAHVLESARNFYGVLRVDRELDPDNGPYRELVHGHIQHGSQFLDPQKSRWPTSYYGEDSGIGLALRHHPRRSAADPQGRTLRIGVLGLGCGTLAAYGTAGDTMRFYEINPAVLRISEEFFTYRHDSAAQVEVVLGDGRVSMERELSDDKTEKFDVLAVDAFSSDSIPMHLLTKECLALYRRRVQPDGLICLHISNNYLDLTGVVYGIAQALECQCVFVDSPADPARGTGFATWAIVTTNKAFLALPAVSRSLAPFDPRRHPPLVWTDDYGSLWQVIKR